MVEMKRKLRAMRMDMVRALGITDANEPYTAMVHLQRNSLEISPQSITSSFAGTRAQSYAAVLR
jgi:hypothetical protein